MSSTLEWKDKPVKYLRDQVVDQLKYSLANDHLEIEEFEQLVRLALSTPSKTELLSLTVDLPVKEVVAQQSQERELVAYQEQESITDILSASKRRGVWVPSKQMNVLSVLSDTGLDFREVELKADVTYISLSCWLSAAKIIVPPGVNVVSNLKNVLGAIKGGNQGRMDPESPTIVIEGKVVLGDVKIVVKGKSD